MRRENRRSNNHIETITKQNSITMENLATTMNDGFVSLSKQMESLIQVLTKDSTTQEQKPPAPSSQSPPISQPSLPLGQPTYPQSNSASQPGPMTSTQDQCYQSIFTQPPPDQDPEDDTTYKDNDKGTPYLLKAV